MLDAGRPGERIAGLTVLHDHADDRLRYVVSDVPRLDADPTPRISLLLFRDEGGGGGLLQLEAELAPSEEQLAAVAAELASRGTLAGRRPVLARPDWRAGRVRLAGWLQSADEGEGAAGGPLAPSLLAVGIPSLVGDPRVVVAARLDAAGAALADASLRGGALPTAVIFELETLGLAGPLAIEAEADLVAIHDRLTAEGALNTPYGRARIAKTWEEAVRDRLIRIEVLDESGDVEGRRAEALRRVGEELLAEMFSPHPPPERPPQLDDESVGMVELSFRLTMRREELATRQRWSFRERRPTVVRHYAAASLLGLLARRDPDDHIRFADLAGEERELVVRAEPELGALGLAALEVDLRWGDEPEGDARTVVLTDGEPEARLASDRPPTEPLLHRVRARFDPAATAAADRETGWLTADGETVVVSARRLFPPRTLAILLGRGELDWIDHVEVEVDAPGEPTRSVLLGGTVRDADVHLPGAGEAPLSVTTHWRGHSGEPSRSTPPETADDDLVLLDSPFGDSIELLVVPRTRPDVVSTTVELVARSDDLTHSRTLTWEEPDRAPRTVALRRLAGGPRSYSWRAVTIHEDGRFEQGDWRETAETTLVVGAEGPTRVHRVEVVLLGGGPAERGSLAVDLALTAGDGSERALLEGSDERAELVLVAPADAPPAVLTSRELMPTGAFLEQRWEEPAELVVLPPPTTD